MAPAHVLQGLLQEQEGRPWLLLKNAGVDPIVIRKPFNAENSAEDWADVQADSAVREILVRAQELARRFGEERTVASEHLLMAVLEMDDALRQTLESQGLRFADLTAAVEPPQGPPIQLEQPLDLSDAPDTMAVARILDANANRAREALRVLEDYCRFILNDAFLSRELKTLRHELAEALKVLPPDLLLLARDTPGDVGTNIATAAEMDRGNVRDVLQAGCKRVQESLRGLEEYGKISSVDFARQIEALRYRSYTLERALLLGTEARTRLEAAKLCVLVSTGLCRLSLAGTVSEAAAGGAQII
ncbi:MAG TPA: Clp protease N-terminal domain-containing protein, partial [Gemmataceae bacterium]|nr:Clp protease N-terminal domain-containing protein [Gemmataceae bacterium]